MANSFKLELFDNENSDDDSDDYTKYNRVKFSPTTVESDTNVASSPSDPLAPAPPQPSQQATNSKSISFSFKNKSTELLKKIQKRNTFAFPKNTKTLHLDHLECSEEASSSPLVNATPSINCENKLFKSKSEHVKKTMSKNLMLNSINLDALDNRLG